jgi:hypothetical protein
MSWIDKEVRRRQKRDSQGRGDTSITPSSGGLNGDAKSIAELWDRLEATNEALPPELKLPRLSASTTKFYNEFSVCAVLLKGSNGAGIGFTGDAIRYIWPVKRLRKSNNLWIKAHGTFGYVVSRRVKTSMPGVTMVEAAFDEQSVDHILKCLVTDRQVTWRTVTRRRFWIF